jgi:type I restriction enzyme S subunit
MSFDARWPYSELGKEAFNASRPFSFKLHPKVVFVNTGDVLQGKFLHSNISDGLELPGQAKKALKADDILLTEIRPSNGRYAYVDFDAFNYVVSTKFMVIESYGRVKPRFLYHVLTNKFALEEFQRIAESRSGTFPQITFESIEHFPIPLPPLSAQDALIVFFDELDARISLHRETNATLEAIAQALFKSWFVDFDPVRAKFEGKLPEGMDETTAALFPDAFAETELGMAPIGWEVKTLGDLIVPKRGKTITKAKCVEGDIPVVAGGLEPAYFHNQSNVSCPVVTISASGANAGFVRLYQQDIWASDCSLISLEQTDSVYFWYVFLKANQEKIYFMQQGAAQPHIYPSDLMRLNIYSSNAGKERAVFNKLVSPLFEKIALATAKIKTLADLRDTLLLRLISGQLRLADAEAELERVTA